MPSKTDPIVNKIRELQQLRNRVADLERLLRACIETQTALRDRRMIHLALQDGVGWKLSIWQALAPHEDERGPSDDYILPDDGFGLPDLTAESRAALDGGP